MLSYPPDRGDGAKSFSKAAIVNDMLMKAHGE
jgi:hypothetical protein